jgi:phospholipid/cholesterol/gamma-HCH transport system substrate-binding protein
MERSLFQNIKLGIFVLSGLVLFIAAIYFIGKRQSIFGNELSIFATFNNINGLKSGNNVRFSGINVGTVKEIEMLNDTTIVVHLSLEKEFIRHIKSDARAVIASDGLVGNMIVNILPGQGKGLPVVSGDTIMSFSRVRTDEMLNTLSVTNENAALLTAELLKITKDISAGNGLIGALIKDGNMKEDFRKLLENLKVTTHESAGALKRINQLVGSLDNKDNLLGTLRDTSTAKQIKIIVNNVAKASSDLQRVVTDLDVTLQNVNAAVINMKDGKGAINYLSNDPALVRKIDKTVTRVDSVMIQINAAGVRLNENLEALKHNWLLRGYFKKQEETKNKK